MDFFNRKRSRIHPVLTLVAISIMAVTSGAGYWQYNRAQFKQDLMLQYHTIRKLPSKPVEQLIRLDQAQMRYRNTDLVGTLLWEKVVFIDNRVRGRVSGYDTVVPLILNNVLPGEERKRIVLVNLGWRAFGAKRIPVDDRTNINGVVKVQGIIDIPKENLFTLSNVDVENRLWPARALGDFKRVFNLDIEPFMVLSYVRDEVQFVESFKEPDFNVNKHYAYMGQWIIFSLMTAVLYFYFGIWRKPQIEHKIKK